MAASTTQCEEKLTKLLATILTPDFHVKNDCYLNSLLSHFSGKENKELGDALLHLPYTVKWIVTALTHWEMTTIPPLPISTFVLNLTALLSEDENIFRHYVALNVYPRLFQMFDTTANAVQPTTKLAYVKILSSMLKHRSGLEWIVSNEIWKDCLRFCLANETIYIIREGHRFVLDLLQKSVEVNELFASAVVFEIVQKLNVGLYSTENAFPEVEDELIAKRLTPTLKLIVFLLENLAMGEPHKNRDYRVASLFIRQKQLEASIDEIVVLARNPNLLFDLNSILFHLYFFDLVATSENDLLVGADIMGLAKKFFRVFNDQINASNVTNVIKLSHLSDSLWNCLKERLPPVPQRPNKEPLLFQNQLITLQMLPVCCISYLFCNVNYTSPHDDDFREEYIDDLFKMLCEDTIRLGYTYRTVVAAQPNGFETAKLAIMYSLKNIKNYNKRRGIKIFQVYTYCLKDMNITITKTPTSVETITKNIGFCMTLLEALAVFINEFEITWRESVETICVTGNTIEFLSHNFWPPRLIVQGLKLIKLTIAKFLSPNLALLIESENDATMDMLGVMLIGKLHDMNWEVRDSALEVLHTMANIANSKYPSFQKMLMNLDAVRLVVTMSASDGEGFVRASALKCLQEMIQVQKFWTEILVHQELPQKMMHTLRNETEAIVRTEAASLMRYIHEYQSFPVSQMGEVYQAMALAATSDLHWEVKSNALDFWGKVILNHLQDQGFIDGKFPNVTFSKENRKIVTLTEAEIRARLNKVLLLLSENGCLSVLVSAIQDDCDLEVARKSLTKTKKLRWILRKYDVCSSEEATPTPQSPRSTISPAATTPNFGSPEVDMSDEVIDQIINSNDAALLQNVYSPDFEPVTVCLQTNLKVVTPAAFIDFLQQDLDRIVDEKCEWLQKMDGLNSLLDDMLKSYEENVNTMDCY